MRAFSILSLAAAAALSFLPSAFAAPVVDAGAVAVAGAGVHARVVDVAAGAKAGAAIHARTDDECSSILGELKVNLGVKIELLSGLTVETATKDQITVILTDVVSIIVGATAEIKALVGTGIICDVALCASLLADILIALCGALAFVLSIVADVSILLDVIVSVALGGCLCELISVVISIVDGLIIAILPLILSLAGTLLSLGLGVVGQLLTIC